MHRPLGAGTTDKARSSRTTSPTCSTRFSTSNAPRSGRVTASGVSGASDLRVRVRTTRHAAPRVPVDVGRARCATAWLRQHRAVLTVARAAHAPRDGTCGALRVVTQGGDSDGDSASACTYRGRCRGCLALRPRAPTIAAQEAARGRAAARVVRALGGGVRPRVRVPGRGDAHGASVVARGKLESEWTRAARRGGSDARALRALGGAVAPRRAAPSE